MKKANVFSRIKNITHNHGFSLIETMVTVLIFSIIAAGLYTILLTGDASWQTNSVQVELQQELRKAMDWMKDDLRQAGSTSIVNVSANGNWYTSIVFKIPSDVVSGALVWQTNSITFYLDADQRIIYRVQGAQTRPIANNITSLQIRRLVSASDIVEVVVSAEKNTFQKTPIQRSLSFEIYLRN